MLLISIVDQLSTLLIEEHILLIKDANLVQMLNSLDEDHITLLC